MYQERVKNLFCIFLNCQDKKLITLSFVVFLKFFQKKLEKDTSVCKTLVGEKEEKDQLHLLWMSNKTNGDVLDRTIHKFKCL